MPAPLQRRLLLFTALLVLLAAALFGHWLLVGRHLQSTDNAYVQGEITRVSSQLNARIERVLVRDNQHVEAGALLAVLEDSDFRLARQRARAALANYQAQLDQARSKLAQQSSLIAASQAEVTASQATLERAQLDLGRAQALRKPGYVSEERVTTLAADQRVEAEVKRLDALILAAGADLEQAELDLARTRIHAPIGGFVGQRAAREGQVVQSGSYLLSLVPDRDIWVQANFKETQIGRMRPGQRAELVFDSYPDTPIEGRIDSLFAASGAQFSLLPPDNATGNFTKVVQRIPVKLTFAADHPLQGLIRPGMSVEVHVDIRDDAQHGG
jgi:membrane fusion protein, multidrug efflux system